MRAPAAQVLKEAARDLHPNETFEKALGRMVRKHQGTYDDYRVLIDKVRVRAKTDRSSLEEAAKALAVEP